MSLTLNMVGGGGGGEQAETDALLKVEAPANAIVTISKGTITKSDNGHQNENNPNVYDYYFIIHQSQFDSVNPWTVTATLGGESASKTIIVDLSDDYYVGLSFPYWIIKDGVEVDNSFVKYSGNSSAVNDTGAIIYKENDNQYTTWYTNTQVDLTNYTQMRVVLTGGKFKYYFRLGCKTTKTALNTQNQNIFDIVSVSLGGGGAVDTVISTETTLSADVSAITGSYWVGFTLEGTSNFTDATYNHGGVKITNVYLE